MNVHHFADAPAAARGCAARILELLTAAIEQRGTATLAVSGGTSPKLMFEIFARSGFAWERVQLFFVDERVVPPTDPQSNFKLANDAWLSQCAFPAANIHRVQTELGAEEAARVYGEDILRRQGGRKAAPSLDVIHRGMGPDSHTASLFPGQPLIQNHTDIAAAVWVEKMGEVKIHQWRVTLLPAVLEAARHTVILVTGPDKAAALRAVLEGPYDPMRHPAQIAREGAEWFVDQAALPDQTALP
jgi:6-phosphogluconolactonase